MAKTGLLLVAVSLALGAQIACADDASVVNTDTGALKGVVTSRSRKFLGVPFAAPPVGALRWAAPAEAARWSGVRDATRFSAGCPQQCNLPPGTCPQVQSEDCLYLNVFTPLGAVANTSKLPVMLFFPGGRFMQGAAGMELYDGENWANDTNTIIVTTNYRLAALGFLVDSPTGGNYGLQDQRLAMRWVQRNAAAFGGDPSRVTISGQSAGATSVACHLVSPPSKGLFHHAIMESNPAALRLKTAPDAMKTASYFADAAGCGSATNRSCMLALSVEDVLSAQAISQKKLLLDHPLELFYPWVPLVGGVDVPKEPLQAIRSGDWSPVPLVIGTVKNDSWLFIYEAMQKKLTYIEYRVLLTLIFGKYEPQVLKLFPTHKWYQINDTRPDLALLGTDYIFACPARAVAEVATDANVPVYLYEFEHAISFDAWGANYSYCRGVTCHGSELPFLFGNTEPMGAFTADEMQLASSVRAAWGSFVRTGVPSSSWPVWGGGANKDAGRAMLFDTAPRGVRPTMGLRHEGCDFFDEIGYAFG